MGRKVAGGVLSLLPARLSVACQQQCGRIWSTHAKRAVKAWLPLARFRSAVQLVIVHTSTLGAFPPCGLPLLQAASLAAEVPTKRGRVPKCWVTC